MNNRRWIQIGGIAALAAAAVYQLSAPWRAPAVDLIAVARGPLTDALAVTGTVEARTVTVAPKVPGRVRTVHVDTGAEVIAAQILIELESEELAARVDEAAAALSVARARQTQAAAALQVQRATAAARLAEAQAELAAARAQRDKARAGARPQERQQAASRVQQAKVALDQAKRELDRVRQAEAAVAAARAAGTEESIRLADLASAKAAIGQAEAALRAARSQLAAATITAPIAGTVVRKDVEVGELLAPGTAVLTVADLREIWVTVDLAAGDVAKVRLGQALNVRSDAYSGRIFPGKVIELSRVADPRFGVGQAWSIRAKVALTDPDRLLRPGVQVDIAGTGALAADTLLVPATAVVTRGDRTGIFVVAGGVARFREISVGVKTSRLVQVLTGVAAGEGVIATPGDALQDGMRVRVR